MQMHIIERLSTAQFHIFEAAEFFGSICLVIECDSTFREAVVHDLDVKSLNERP